MASHTNASEAHAFYYKGVNNGDSKSYAGCTLSFEGKLAYSYSTCVARVIPTAGFSDDTVNTDTPSSGITLLSYNGMSNTTSRHISLLAYSSPFDIVHVPMRFGSRYVDAGDIKRMMLDTLETALAGVSRKESRKVFMDMLRARDTLIRRTDVKWHKPLLSKEFDKFLAVDVSEYAKELAQKTRREAAERAAATKKIFKKHTGGKRGADYLEFLRTVFDSGYTPKGPDISRTDRLALRRKLNGNGAAYVWIAGDKIVTSKQISVPVDEAAVLLRAWGLGKDMRKMRIQYYSILSYTGNEIKIGCHTIPRENMLALYEAVIGKPFPAKGVENEGKEP